MASRFNPSIDMQLDCSYGDLAVARTSDPARNRIALTLQNTGAVDLLWKQGAGAGAGQIIIDFGPLLTIAEVDRVVVTAEGWTGSCVKTPDGATWLLQPDQDVVLRKNRTLRITIAIPEAGGQANAGPHDFSLTCRSLRNAGDPANVAQADKTLDAFLVLAPCADKPGNALSSVVSCTVEPQKVFCWDRNASLIDNTITLAIANRQMKAPLVPAGTAWTGQPVFQIVFPAIRRPAPGEDPAESSSRKALTYLDHAKQIRLRGVTSENAAHPWIGREKPEALLWEIRPDADGGPTEPRNLEILGPGGAVMVEFGPIRTELPAFPTQIYVLYSHVPGYDDGYITVPLWKEPPKPTIIDFHAEKPEIAFGEDATLSWTTMGADQIEISYEDDGGKVTLSSANAGKEALPYPSGTLVVPHPRATTNYTLTLRGGQGVSTPPQMDAGVTVGMAAISLAASQAETHKGAAIVLDWLVTGPWAFEGTLHDDQLALGAAGVPVSKAADQVMTGPLPIAVSPQATTTYTLRGISKTPAPRTLSANVVVAVCPPLVKRFEPSSRATLDLHQSVTLAWDTAFASGVSLVATPDMWDPRGGTDTVAWKPGLTLPAGPPNGSGVPKRSQVDGLPEAGTIVVTPDRTTNYALICDGLNPPRPSVVTVNVNTVVIRNFVASRIQGPSDDFALTLGFVGEYIDFTMAGAYATGLRIEQDAMWPRAVWSVDHLKSNDGKDATFHCRVQVLSECVYTLVAEGPSGPVRWPIAITFAGGPKIKWFKMIVQHDEDRNAFVLTFNWGTVGASRWKVGAIDKDTLISGVDGDEHPVRFTHAQEFDGQGLRDSQGNAEGPDPMQQLASRTMTVTLEIGEYGVPPDFLEQNVFYLAAQEHNGSMAILRAAETVRSFDG